MAYPQNPTPVWSGSRHRIRSTAGSAEYYLTASDPSETIYTGLAQSRPGESFVEVELFDLIAPLLHQVLPAALADVYGNDADALELAPISRTFALGTNTGYSAQISKCANWAYGEDAPVGPFLGAPLSMARTVGPNQPVIMTALYCPAGNVTVVRVRTGAAVATLNNATARPLNILLTPRTLAAIPAGESFRVRLPDGSISPDYVRAACGLRWVVCYVNAFGGWDMLPLKGGARRTDAFTRQGVELDFRRTYASDAHRRDYIVDASMTWDLRPGVLADGDSVKWSRHLPGTPLAVLIDTARSLVYPVSVAATSVEADRTITTNGRRMVEPSLAVKLNQTRHRV